ncbi:MAG: alpha-L-rhamnosidase C-terminal domain-containing protein, partial [Acidimicrobiales bacterium]
DDPAEVIRRSQVALVARHATMPEVQVATFRSSDQELDAVWNLCAHSGLYTSQEQFIDTPTREKGQFLWDSANESQTVMRTFGDQNLTWQGLRDMARAQVRYWAATGEVNEVYPNDDGPQDYPTFTALYPEWVWRYYLSTSDADTVTGLLLTLARVSDFLANVVDPSTGLISNQPMSTNGDNEYGYDYNTYADTTLNILAINAFRRIEQVAGLAGDLQVAVAQATRAAALTVAVNTRLISKYGLYVDGLQLDGNQSPHSSQQANLAALAYGVAPSALVGEIGKFVASLDISVEPDHGMELLRSLHAAGRDADVVRILTDASFPGWAAILRDGGTFTWETWTPSDLIGDSMSHGWGSSALVAIQEALLGTVPVAPEPGGSPTVLMVTPPSGGLTKASGSFPTPSGSFAVAWSVPPDGRTLSIRVPPNAEAQCHFRDTRLSAIRESGMPVESAPGARVLEVNAGEVVVSVGTGSYAFRVL